MYIAVLLLFIFSIILFVLSGLFKHSAPGQLRSSLIALTILVLICSLLKIFHYCCNFIFNLNIPVNFDTISNLAYALSGTIGISIIIYLNTGRWHRIFFFLSLFSLLPDYGIFISSLIWLVIPFLMRNISPPQSESQSRMHIMLQTIHTGTLAGGLIFFLVTLFRIRFYPPFHIELIGPLISTLFLYAGLHAKDDPENEFTYSEVVNLVKVGIIIILPLSILPHLLMNWENGIILIRFLHSAFNLIVCFILILLTIHFDSASIRMFLILLVLAIIPEIAIQLYSERIVTFVQNGLHLVSRTFLVLSVLFVLKQYLRWGFEIVQTMVMIITAVSAASIVFLIIYVLQPEMPLHRLFAEDEILKNGTLFINFVILLALPPVLINYSLGTMRVTWAILTIGVFFIIYSDFLSGQFEIQERNVSSLLGTGLIMLAFMTLWRYINAMIHKIHEISKILDES